MNILSIDHGTVAGWSRWRRDLAAPMFGTVELPRCDAGNPGRLFTAWREWMSYSIALERPDKVYCEQQIAEHLGLNAAFILVGLAAHTVQICDAKGIPWRHVTSSTVRKFFCGSGAAKKDDVGAECRRRGWRVGNHNAADACALGAYAWHAERQGDLLPGLLAGAA